MHEDPYVFFLMIRRPPRSTLFPLHDALPIFTRARLSWAIPFPIPASDGETQGTWVWFDALPNYLDRKSTLLNSSHANISYAVFCLKKKKKSPISNTL